MAEKPLGRGSRNKKTGARLVQKKPIKKMLSVPYRRHRKKSISATICIGQDIRSLPDVRFIGKIHGPTKNVWIMFNSLQYFTNV